jgi:hypothetical protein
MHAASPNACYIPCLSHPHWLHHSNSIRRKKQVMKLLIMEVSSSCHFIPLRSKYSLQQSVLKYLQSTLCSSLNVRDQVSHPYKTTEKIIGYLLLHVHPLLGNGLVNKFPRRQILGKQSVARSGNNRTNVYSSSIAYYMCTDYVEWPVLCLWIFFSINT